MLGLLNGMPRRRLVIWMIVILCMLHLAPAVEVSIGADGSLEEQEVEEDDDDDEICKDLHDGCPEWAEMGECTENPSYMLLDCKISCNMCDCIDVDVERCPHWAYHNQCAGEQEEFMYTNCLKSCDACGYSGEALDKLKDERRKIAAIGGDARLLETKYGYEQYTDELDYLVEVKIQKIVKETADYMERRVYIEDQYKNVRKTCMIRNDLCAYWKIQGMCESNKRYMRQQCAPVCQICEELDFHFWCPIDETKLMALPNPGDLNSMFERIIAGKKAVKYSPKVISRPQSNDASAIQEGPWVIEFESFLSAEESQHLIDLGAQTGYEPSVDTGFKRNDGTFDQVTSTWRTSTTAWCSGSCMEDPVVQKVAQRVEDLTGIPQENAEHLQLLKYETDAFYSHHHDFTPHHVERQMGPRVLTFFLYLNTVEAGGETNFPDINVTVIPKVGKAVLWPNVLDDDPLKVDRRTAHQALPVENGHKYGANLWIHQRDWREVAARGCI